MKNYYFLSLFFVLGLSMLPVSCGKKSSNDVEISDTLRYGAERCDIFVSKFEKQQKVEEITDDNIGNPCAQIWIYGPDIKSFEINFGVLEIVKKVEKVDCIGVIVSADAKNINLSHPQYGDYSFTLETQMVAGYSYKLVLMGDDLEEGFSDSKDAGRQAEVEYANGNYSKAFALWRKVVADDATANSHLGHMYKNGLGTHIDFYEAAKCFQAGANAGDVDCQGYYGLALELGQGVSQSYEEAAIWYTKAAEMGNEMAQCNLGIMYQYGNGVEKDVTQAFSLLKRAAEAGSDVAQFNLSIMYREGSGIDKDIEESLKWLRKSAAQGYPSAEFDLGNTYFMGEDIPQDYSRAVYYFEKSAAKGNAEAYNMLAFCYAEGNGVEQDMSMAVDLINSAIDASKGTKKLFYMDSKGEFMLMMHKEDVARQIWDEIVSIDKDYAMSELADESVLYEFVLSGENPY